MLRNLFCWLMKSFILWDKLVRPILDWLKSSLFKELRIKTKMVLPDIKLPKHWQIISIFLKVALKDFSLNTSTVNVHNFLTLVKFLWKKLNVNNSQIYMELNSLLLKNQLRLSLMRSSNNF